MTDDLISYRILGHKEVAAWLRIPLLDCMELFPGFVEITKPNPLNFCLPLPDSEVGLSDLFAGVQNIIKVAYPITAGIVNRHPGR